MLVGFAGTKATTQSSTIRVLLLLLKINYAKKSEENALNFDDFQFQDFLRKVTKIIVLFLKDHTAPHELHRSVLKYIKTVVSFLPAETLKGEMAEAMIQGMLTLPRATKFNQLQKKILSKFIKKLGLVYVKGATPAEHVKLIDYIERERRKRVNKVKKRKLLALLGQEDKPKSKVEAMDVDMKDDDEDEDATSSEEEEEANDHDERYSLDSDSEDEEDDDVKGGRDTLMTDTIDIPRVDDIPIVSKLAREKQQMQAQGQPKSKFE